MVVAGWFRDGVVAGRLKRHGKTPGDRLHVLGVGLLARVPFAGVGAGLAPRDIGGSGQRQQVAALRGVQEIARLDHLLAFGRGDGHRTDPARTGFGSHQAGFPQDLQPAPADRCGQHRLQDLGADLRLVADAGDRSAARIEVRLFAERWLERVVVAVKLAHLVAVAPVACRTAAFLNPAVFVRGHALAAGLAAQPGGLLGQDNRFACFGQGQGCGHAAKPATDDRDITGYMLVHGPFDLPYASILIDEVYCHLNRRYAVRQRIY